MRYLFFLILSYSINSFSQNIFNSKTDVLNFLSNKSFSTYYKGDSSVIHFTSNGKTLEISTNGIFIGKFNYTIYDPLSKNMGFLDYGYDVGQNSFYSRLEINSLDNTLEVHSSNLPSSGFSGASFFLDTSFKNKFVKQESDGWIKKSITKFQKLNSETKEYDDFMLLNPGKYIEIKDNKDIRIADLDIFELVIGKEFIGVYNQALFTNGIKQQTDLPQTERYLGDVVLKNSLNESGKTDKAGLFFFYNNGVCSAIEIKNKICMCDCRIFFTDYTEMQILK